MPRAPVDPQLTLDQAAALAGIQASTWRSYAARQWPRANPVPEPDGETFGRRWWYESTVKAWMKRRPGRTVRTDLETR